jgi:MraZ protein
VVKSGKKWTTVEQSSGRWGKVESKSVLWESGHFWPFETTFLCAIRVKRGSRRAGHMKLRGNCQAKVDEKGRLKIPAVFLEALKEYGNQFYITSTTGESARIYPMKVWSGIEDKLAGVSSQNRAKRKFLMRTSYYGQTVELDGQGRVLVPAVLRESAQMKGEVDVFGNLDYLEVMNHTRVLDDLKNSPYTEEDDKALEDLGI